MTSCRTQALAFTNLIGTLYSATSLCMSRDHRPKHPRGALCSSSARPELEASWQASGLSAHTVHGKAHQQASTSSLHCLQALAPQGAQQCLSARPELEASWQTSGLSAHTVHGKAHQRADHT